MSVLAPALTPTPTPVVVSITVPRVTEGGAGEGRASACTAHTARDAATAAPGQGMKVGGRAPRSPAFDVFICLLSRYPVVVEVVHERTRMQCLRPHPEGALEGELTS